MKPCSWNKISVPVVCSIFACIFLGFKVSFATLIFYSQRSLFFIQVVYYIRVEEKVVITSSVCGRKSMVQHEFCALESEM